MRVKQLDVPPSLKMAILSNWTFCRVSKSRFKVIGRSFESQNRMFKQLDVLPSLKIENLSNWTFGRVLKLKI